MASGASVRAGNARTPDRLSVKRRWGLILLAAAALSAIPGCGGKGSASASGEISGGDNPPASTRPTAVPSSPLPVTPTAGPASVKLGLYTELPGLTAAASLTLRESQLGRTIAIHHTFYDWTDSFPGVSQLDDKAHGRVPLITWWGTYYRDINDGS